MRVGTGYDVHRLTQGRDLILGGVKIPFEKGLLGHSDADVLLHAVMDALLGAAALVYGLPVVLFLLGYLLPSSLLEPGRCLCGGLGFAMGLAGAAACDRLVKKRSGISYRIVRKL